MSQSGGSILSPSNSSTSNSTTIISLQNKLQTTVELLLESYQEQGNLRVLIDKMKYYNESVCPDIISTDENTDKFQSLQSEISKLVQQVSVRLNCLVSLRVTYC